MLSGAMIFVGYAALIAEFGLPGLGCGVLHVIVMMLASRKLGRQA